MPLRKRTAAMLALLFIGLLTSNSNGQTTTSAMETSKAEEPAARKRGDALKEEAQNTAQCGGSAPCLSEKIKTLRLGVPGRFARGLQYQYELIEQPETIFINQGSGAGEISAFLRNPQDYLQKHTLTFKFSELFPDRLSLFKRGSDYLKTHPETADEQLSNLLCGDNPLITCLAKGGDWWQRALMGTSFNVNLSQRALVQRDVIAPASRFGKGYLWNGGFTFDPAMLFPTATKWKSTFDDVKNIDKALALVGANDATGNKQPWKSLWSAIIPKVEFKILSQFDFVKFGGALREPDFPESALSTWTFTWDLTRAIPDTKSRVDADAIAAALADLENNLGVDPPLLTWKKSCILYLDPEVRKLKDLHPAFGASSCQELARIMKAKRYQLSCELVDKDGAEKDRENGPENTLNAQVKPPGNSCKW